MENITVNKGDLIAKLKENREAHKAEYEKAVEIYRERFVADARKFADDAIIRARQGVAFGAFSWLPVPEEHTDDYDRVISLMEWELEDTVELSEYDFAQYVLNEWGWAKSFASNTRSYTTGVR